MTTIVGVVSSFTVRLGGPRAVIWSFFRFSVLRVPVLCCGEGSRSDFFFSGHMLYGIGYFTIYGSGRFGVGVDGEEGTYVVAVSGVVHRNRPALHESTSPIAFPLSTRSQGVTTRVVRFLSGDRSRGVTRRLGLHTNINLTTPRVSMSGHVITLLVPKRCRSSPPRLTGVVFGPGVVDRSVRDTYLGNKRNYLSISHRMPNFIIERDHVAMTCRSTRKTARGTHCGNCTTVMIRRRVSRLGNIVFCSRVGRRTPFTITSSIVVVR